MTGTFNHMLVDSEKPSAHISSDGEMVCFSLGFYLNTSRFSPSLSPVTERARTADPAEGPGAHLPGAAGTGPQHSFISAEPGHAHSAPDPHGAVLERVLHQRQGSFQSHDGEHPQQPRVLQPAEVCRLERLPSWNLPQRIQLQCAPGGAGSRRGRGGDGRIIGRPEGVATAGSRRGLTLPAQGLHSDMWVWRAPRWRHHVRHAAPGCRCRGDTWTLWHGISRSADVHRVADWLPDWTPHDRQLYQMAQGKLVTYRHNAPMFV